MSIEKPNNSMGADRASHEAAGEIIDPPRELTKEEKSELGELLESLGANGE
jgi:hypothetical protein